MRFAMVSSNEDIVVIHNLLGYIQINPDVLEGFMLVGNQEMATPFTRTAAAEFLINDKNKEYKIETLVS